MLLPISDKQLKAGYFKALKAISGCKTRKDALATDKLLKVVNAQLIRQGYYIEVRQLVVLWIAQVNAIRLKE